MSFKAEDIDIDSFLNLDSQFHSPSLANLNKNKNIIAPQYQPQQPLEHINTYAPLHTSQFSGPSHQYDQHKQHIPLPPGALANSYAAAQPDFQFNGFSTGYHMGSNIGFLSSDDIFDFTPMNNHKPSYSASNDMDMDFDSPADGMYIDPNAIGGHEEDSPIPAKAEIVRVYPGMHAHQAQQAALAKQQQQNEIQRRQALKNNATKTQSSAQKTAASKIPNKAPVDPAVEERISRLLNQMRQTANGPSQSHSEEQSPPPMSKSRKEEEDMDEDERLLASEEGKKLSSKERRQLRNKVSARAFRSRRKEYIGQLEGEVAQKSTEADTLRAENEALKAENTRLTDLTKLLLSSSAFSSFLNDLSSNGLPASVVAPQPSQSITPPSEPQQSQSQTPQPSMSTIAEEEIDFNSLDVNATWSSGMDFSFAPQVFAVTQLPEAPIVDVAALTGKTTQVSEIFSHEKEIVPIVEVAPVTSKIEPEYFCDNSIIIDESDPAFSLFAQSSQQPTQSTYEIFGSIAFEKATERFTLIEESETGQDDTELSTVTMARFEQLCSSLDSLSSRLDRLILN